MAVIVSASIVNSSTTTPAFDVVTPVTPNVPPTVTFPVNAGDSSTWEAAQATSVPSLVNTWFAEPTDKAAGLPLLSPYIILLIRNAL